MVTNFDEAWAVDFEFTAPPGERPAPICMVARELHSGRTIRLWQDQFGPAPPFSIGKRALFVAYYAPAELGCFRALGWAMPANILDLYVEFRDGLELPAGRSLVGALVFHGLDHIGAGEKEELRAIASVAPPSPKPSALRSSITAEPTLMHCGGSCQRWRRGSIFREHCYAVALWRLWRRWSITAFRSTPKRWHCCARIGITSKTI
jgi:hypothetical protein